jgi:hypothetical protein
VLVLWLPLPTGLVCGPPMVSLVVCWVAACFQDFDGAVQSVYKVVSVQPSSDSSLSVAGSPPATEAKTRSLQTTPALLSTQ